MVLTDAMRVTYTIGSWAAGGTDVLGCRWSVPTTNLFDGAGRRTRVVDRPFGPGAYRSRSWTAGRSLTLQGWCMATAEPSWPSLVAARRWFMGLFPEGSQQVLVVDDGVAPRRIAVELAEAGRKWEWWPGDGGADWQLDLYAADPRWLSTVERTATATVADVSVDGLDWAAAGGGAPGGLDWAVGSPGVPGGLDWGSSGEGQPVLVLENAGSATTWPVLTCTTPSVWEAPTFVDPVTGGVLAYAGVVAAGQSLRIDCSPFTASPVTLDGVDRSGALASADFLSLPPGAVRAVQVTGIGEGTATATWRDADE